MFERKKLRPIILVLATLLCIFQLSTSLGIVILDPMVIRSVHVGIILALIFLWRPPVYEWKKHPRPEPLWVLAWDLFLLTFSVVACAYIAVYEPELSERMPQVDEVEPYQIILGAGLCFCIMEAVRRVSDWSLVIVTLVALVYAFWGHLLPGNLGHLYLEADRIIESLYLLGDGIWGSSIGASASVIFLFILFGATLDKTGFSGVFIDIVCLLTRSAKGGPAKAAIFGSALFGSVSGSAVANVYATGTFTIPLMKKVGYRPHFAGAVEAVASSGGLIMPPVMGSIAFVMAEYTNVSYLEVCKAALLPAVLYYASLFMMIHFEACRYNLGATPADMIPPKKEIMRKLYYLAPLIILIGTMLAGRSVVFSAVSGTASAIVLSFLRKDTRLTIGKVFDILESTASNMLMIAACCACVGIIIGVVTMTGFGFGFVNIMTTLAKLNMTLFLLILMIACLLFGLGLPSLPAYILVATFGAPVLVQAGIPVLAAHLFVMYFAITSGITPPTCQTAFAGASIADAQPMKTGWTAFYLAIAAYIVPFVFIFNPAMLLMGEWPVVIMAVITALVGVVCLAGAVQGWFLIEASWPERAILMVAAITLLIPGTFSDAIGVSALILALLFQIFRKKRLQNAAS